MMTGADSIAMFTQEVILMRARPSVPKPINRLSLGI